MPSRLTAFNPFPGLRPFEAAENHLFFGRDGQSHDLLRKLRRNRFVSVVGTSGSGKSSLVRAGLLPALHGGFMARAGSSWRIAVFRPGHDPIGNLAHALNAREVFGETKVEIFDQATIIETTLARSDLGLVEATRQARLPAGENLLIVVDQFEELFRFKQATNGGGQSQDEAAAFVTLLLEATKAEEAHIYVVLTMRSDFLGDCSQFRDLPEAMNEGQYLIPRMTRAQRNAAITGPVAVGRGEIAPRLVQRLLNDVGDNPDQLPIMQHALMRTWDHWSFQRGNGDAMDLDDYETIGAMDQALSFHADEAYEELADDGSKEIAESLFKTLSERGSDNREIRRPTRLGQICDIAGADEKKTAMVIDTFRRPGRSFLMPPAGVALTKDTLVDVSHESLIRNWRQLKKWVDEEAQSAQIYRRLAETAVLYREDKAGYWRDPDLQIALNWREETSPNAAWGQLYHHEFDDAVKFLDDSKANRDAEVADIEAARERELKQARQLAAEQSKAAKRMRFVLVLLTVLAVAAILAGVAFFQRQGALSDAATAEIERLRAERQRMIADSTATAMAILFTEADSLQRVASAAAEAEKGARLESEEQRQVAIAARDSASIERERAEAQAALADIRSLEAVAARDSALKSQRQVQAVALAINAQRLQQQGQDTLSALLALEAYRFDDLSGRQFLNEVYNALRTSLNALSDNQGGPSLLPAPTDLINAMHFDSGTNQLALGGADSTVQVLSLDRTTSPILLGKHRGSVTTVAFSRDASRLASGGADYAIQLWALPILAPAVELTGHRARVSSVAFNATGKVLVSVSLDGSIRLWDLRDETKNREIQKLPRGVTPLSFGADGKRLAVGSSDGRVLLINIEDPSRPVVASTIDLGAAPRTLSFSSNGKQLASGCEDGAIRLISLPSQNLRTLRGHQRRVNSVAFNAEGSTLASGSSDRTIRLWNLRQLDTDPIVLGGHSAPIRSIAFTASGDTLVAATFGKDIPLWLTNLAKLADMTRTRVQRNLTLEEWQEFVGQESEYPYRD